MRETLAFHGVTFQSVVKSFFKTPVFGALLWYRIKENLNLGKPFLASTSIQIQKRTNSFPIEWYKISINWVNIKIQTKNYKSK